MSYILFRHIARVEGMSEFSFHKMTPITYTFSVSFLSDLENLVSV